MVLNWIQYSQVENRSDERVPCPGKGEGRREGTRPPPPKGHRKAPVSPLVPRGRARSTQIPGNPDPLLSCQSIPLKITWNRPGRGSAKSFFGFLWGFFLVRNSRICQRCLLGLGGCARPWLQGQASSPWIPGSLSCPNCCPEKL